MDWNRAIGQDGQMLKRIVMVLLSLAALADDVGAGSGLRRFYVLWLLRRAEAVVSAFAVETGMAAPLDDPGSCIPRWGTASEAARLAASFRALALALYGFARHVQRVTQWRGERRLNGTELSAHLYADQPKLAAHRPLYADTS